MRMTLLLCVALFCGFVSQSQTTTKPILDRHIDVSFKNEKITTVLARIGALGSFSFSYNSAIVSSEEVVTIDMKDAAVREVLNEVFKGSMTYKEKGNHLILTRVVVKAQKANLTPIIISGYVEDWFTNEKIVDVSVYEKSSITSVVTDQFGFFRLKLEKKDGQDLLLSISKRDFIDTTLVISEPTNQYFHVSLKRTRPISPIDTLSVTPIEEPQQQSITEEDTAVSVPSIEPEMLPEEEVRKDDVPMPYKESPNVENIRDTLYRDIQVSILPFVGTNGPMSGNIINDYSINFFGGYSMGTRQIELGFFFNIDRGDVSFLQIAGFGNIDGGNVTGGQAAGFFNINGGRTTAAQAAGFLNLNFDDFHGVQTAGFANINMESASGVRAAGFLNMSNGNSTGASIAGFANIHKGDFDGPMIAGFTNLGGRGTLRGTQISGFLNRAGNVYGTQIGFLNVADSLTGVPVGFLSIVKHGYHKLEISADEIFYSNLAFRSGVRAFHNIIFVGIQPQSWNSRTADWTAGYGLGSAQRIFRWMDLNIDVTSQYVARRAHTGELSSLNKAQIGFDFRLAKKFSLYAGGTLNVYLSRTTIQDYPDVFPDVTPQIFSDRVINGDVNMRMWFGGKIALRFF